MLIYQRVEPVSSYNMLGGTSSKFLELAGHKTYIDLQPMKLSVAPTYCM